MFTNTKALTIPDGEVTKIAYGNTVLWEKIEEASGRIPREYQEVEWIGNNVSAGVKAYLNLGFAFDAKARIEMSQHVQAKAVGGGYAFGAAENSGKLRCMLTSPNSSNANYIFYGSTGSAYISVNPSLIHSAYNEMVHTLESGNLHSLNNTTNNEDSKNTQGSYTMTNNLFLFAQNYNGTARTSGTTRIGYFRYYDKNDLLICDLVPCYRKSDGVIGMYDIIRNTFLTDASGDTKVFEKGEDVTAAT